ncbi:radical SAM protein [uncultured Desulfobacter sp.]|uniref:radical SAM/SPASM domain-containing protein n=1 Tax=uncultured Desulfobacter sp. TaxID=240139 RepID=UPI0029F5442F|nr:radical SAM protein [uncultured Desulfobacter sp.]
MKTNVGWKPQLSYFKQLHHHLLRSHGNPSYGLYRLRWHIGPKFFYAGKAPMNLIIEPSSLCNLECIMCSDRFSPRPRGNMDEGLFVSIVRQARELCIPSIKFSYAGEPLMHPHFFEMLEYLCSNTNSDISFLTNGTFLTPENSRRAVDFGVAEIIVSVDGLSKKVYETIRRKASYDRVIGNIEALLTYKRKLGKKLPLIRIQFTRQRDNAHETEAFVSYWKPRVDIVTINEYARPVDCDNNCEDYSADKLYSDRFAETYTENPCSQLWQRLAILWNGDVVPCNGEYVIGNINYSTIAQIWQSEKLKQLRLLHKQGFVSKDPHCKVCGYRNLA